jgi:hypothetical protein
MNRSYLSIKTSTRFKKSLAKKKSHSYYYRDYIFFHYISAINSNILKER